MRRTISYKGEVLYVVEKRGYIDNYSANNPNFSAYDWKKVNKQTHKGQTIQWINPDEDKL